MISCGAFPCLFSSTFDSAGRDAGRLPSEPWIRIRELTERDRRRLLMHFLSLTGEDRRLRFGSPLSDEALTRYVQHIDFHRDVLFGAYDDTLTLIGVAHLSFVPRDAFPAIANVTAGKFGAELGLSVRSSERGEGIGAALLKRAEVRCRNEGIDTIFMHCLLDNQAMIHVARKAGMEIHTGQGGMDACLKLAPDRPV
jgi:RimJ/RimL family protein N-acetyltransferase